MATIPVEDERTVEVEHRRDVIAQFVRKEVALPASRLGERRPTLLIVVAFMLGAAVITLAPLPWAPLGAATYALLALGWPR